MKRFVSRPLFFALLSLLLFALSFSTGLILQPEKADPIPSFEADLPALKQALVQAKENAALVPGGQDSVAFFESALAFSLSPWSGHFAEQGLGLRARLLVQGADTAEIDRALKDRDGTALAALLDRERAQAGLDSDRERAKKKEEDLLLFSIPYAMTPQRNAALYEVRLLKESLETGRDRFGGTDRPLSDRELSRTKALLSLRTKALLSPSCPAPANLETLYGGERITVLLSALILLLFCGTAKKEGALPLPARTALFAGILLLLSFLALALTSDYFAPGTAETSVLFFGGRYYFLPFAPALLLRLLFRFAAEISGILLCLGLRMSGGKGKRAVAFLPLARYLLLSLRPAVFGLGEKVLTLLSPGETAFPLLSAYAETPFPLWMSLLLWGCAIAGSALFYAKKKGHEIS